MANSKPNSRPHSHSDLEPEAAKWISRKKDGRGPCQPAGRRGALSYVQRSVKCALDQGNSNMFSRIINLALGIVLLSSNAFALQVQAESISSEKYFEVALNEINSAKTSITMAMYLISALPDQPESLPNQLLNALIKAKERGVDVKIILDQNIDFESETKDDVLYSNKNQQAYELLKKNNISVYFDTPDIYTHAKTIIIDNETVILGSTNWSKAAFTRNNEANVLIRSKEFALNLLNDINQIKLQENVPQSLTPTVGVPKSFLEDNKLIGEMASQSDERAFDTYLYLLKTYNENHEGKITVDYENLAAALGIDEMSKEDYRRQINKVLGKLDEKYKLIKFETPSRNQNTEVTIVTNPSEAKLEIPTTFWRYGWNTSLPFSSKVMYLINLAYSKASPDGRFSISREKLSKAHNISESFISDGNKELRRLNLLDIRYSELEDLRFSQRQANSYTLLQLYNPDDLKKDLEKLSQKHGKEKYDRAVQTASLVFEEHNPKTIQALIDLEDKYGQAIIEEASKKISEKNPDNPKRSAGYLINTIKSMGTQKQ